MKDGKFESADELRAWLDRKPPGHEPESKTGSDTEAPAAKAKYEDRGASFDEQLEAGHA